MPFQFPDPSITPLFTGSNGITYSWHVTDDKRVVKGFAVPDDCPKYTAIAVNYVSVSDPTPQIAVSWFAYGNQNGSPFSEVRLHGYGLEADYSAQFIFINDTQYNIYGVSILGGDPVYAIDAVHGNLNALYEGTKVTVHLCQPCEEVCKCYVDSRFDDLQDQINALKGVTLTKLPLMWTYNNVQAGQFSTNSSNVGTMSAVQFHPDDGVPKLKVGDEVMFTGKSLGCLLYTSPSPRD